MAAAPRSAFVNLVIGDLPRSKAFFEQLGFRFNAQFTNDEAACLIINDTAYFMLHTPASMRRFTPKPPHDPATHVAAIFGFSVGDRAEVDAVADRALASGGAPSADPQDHGFMYLRSFLDPDGHHWEVFWMDPGAVQPSA